MRVSWWLVEWLRKNNRVGAPLSEREFILALLDEIEDSTVRNRMGNLVIWYVDQSEANKHKYYFSCIVSIGVNAAIPVMNIMMEQSQRVTMAVSLMSAVAAFVVSLSNLAHYNELWMTYRSTVEKIKQYMTDYVVQVKHCCIECKNYIPETAETETMGTLQPDNRKSCCQPVCKVKYELEQELLEKVRRCTTSERNRWEEVLNHSNQKNEAKTQKEKGN